MLVPRNSRGVFCKAVGVDECGERLDRWIAKHANISVNRAKLLCSSGEVRYNGKPCPKGQTTKAGDEIEFLMPDPNEQQALPDESVSIDIVHEDTAVVVISKPAGVPSHPLEVGEKGTVANFLVAKYPEMAEVGYGPREPGILHRLDTGTSGLMVAARDSQTFEQLKEAMNTGMMEKHYRALCSGSLQHPLVVGYPIASHPTDDKRVLVCREPEETKKHKAQEAFTYVVGLAQCGSATSVRLVLGSGRRHQIRAHMAEIGHPLIGDAIYEGAAIEGLEHHMLHAEELAFFHPVNNELVRFRQPLPEQFIRTRESLRNA